MPKQYDIGSLEEYLKTFGFTGKQARIYMAALALGPSSVQRIAERAELTRTNTYDAIDALVRRGLMSITTSGARRIFIAEPPARLREILAEQGAELETVLPQLSALQEGAEHKPRIRFYPGLEGYKQAYEDTLTSVEKRLFGIFSVQDMWDVVGREYADRMIARRVRKGIALKVIRSKERDVGYAYPSSTRALREMRYAPAGMVFPITTFVYDHKVVFLSSKKETFGLVIESADIARAHRNYFQAVWELSVPDA